MRKTRLNFRVWRYAVLGSLSLILAFSLSCLCLAQIDALTEAVQGELSIAIEEVLPTDPEQPPEGETPPTDPEQPPEGETPPTDPEQPPEGETPPTDPEQPPEGETPPTDPEQPPEGETPPTDPEQPPEGETPPTDSEQPPVTYEAQLLDHLLAIRRCLEIFVYFALPFSASVLIIWKMFSWFQSTFVDSAL